MSRLRQDLHQELPDSHLPPLPPAAIRELLEAHAYARDLGCDVWEFAMDVGTLRRQGMTDNQLRWLLMKDYLAQAVERTRPDAARRSFRPIASPRLREGAWLVLSAAGVAFAAAQLHCPGLNHAPRANGTPVWNAAVRELRLGEVIVKCFKQPAPNQELILDALQEEAWPPRIDDPLPPAAGQDGKRRLHSTIANLNHYQQTPLLQFHGGGNGKSICWRLLPTASDTRATAELV
jgi:hypothetical protein